MNSNPSCQVVSRRKIGQGRKGVATRNNPNGMKGRVSCHVHLIEQLPKKPVRSKRTTPEGCRGNSLRAQAVSENHSAKKNLQQSRNNGQASKWPESRSSSDSAGKGETGCGPYGKCRTKALLECEHGAVVETVGVCSGARAEGAGTIGVRQSHARPYFVWFSAVFKGPSLEKFGG